MSTVDLLRSGMQQMQSGQSLDSDTIGGGSPSNSRSPVEGEDYVQAQESTVDDFLSDSEGHPQDSSEKAQEPASSKAKPDQKTSGEKETITISDDKGRRKIEIDYGNREQLKKYVQMAYGARKWQAERDQARQEVTGVKTQLGELKASWDTLEGAFRNQGIEGVIDLLEGRQGAHKAWVQKQIERQEFIRRASPEELEALESREKAETSRREMERIRKEHEELRKQVTEEREQSELRNVESKVHPVFDRYRFSGKLGNENTEARLDKMLWTAALESLEPYEDRGVAITPEMIEKAFRSEAASLRSMIGQQAEKKAARALEQKKKEATENVQTKVMSGYKTGGVAKEARDLIDSRNLTGLLKGWGKYGSLFNK